MKDTFVLKTKYAKQTKILSIEQRGMLWTAIFAHQLDEELPKMDEATYMAFVFITTDLEENAEKYRETCKANAKKARKRWNNNSSTVCDDMQEDTAACSGIQEDANDADYDSDYDCDCDSDCDNGSTPPKSPPKKGEAAKSPPVPFKKIMELYNSICVSFPKIQLIDGSREDAVRARFNKHKDIKTFDALFRKAEASDFLKGGNDRNWRADFDWLMIAANLAKVLEGKYDNERWVKHAKHSGNIRDGTPKEYDLTGFTVATAEDFDE